MHPRKRDTSQSHTEGPFSGPALTIMSFNVEGLSAAKQQLVADLSSKHRCAGDPPWTKRHPAQRTRNGLSHREAPCAVWQCHMCDIRHHRQRNNANRGQQHRDPESRSAWNLSDIGLQTARWTFLFPPATDCGRRPTSRDHWGLQQPQFDLGLCYD